MDARFTDVLLVPDEATFEDLQGRKLRAGFEAAKRCDSGTLEIIGGALTFAGRRNPDLRADGIDEVSILSAPHDDGPFPVAVRIVHGPDRSTLLFTNTRGPGDQRKWAADVLSAVVAADATVRVAPDRRASGQEAAPGPREDAGERAVEESAPLSPAPGQQTDGDAALREEVRALAAAQGWPLVAPAGAATRVFGGALVGAWIGMLLLVAGNRFQDLDRLVGLVLAGDSVAVAFVALPALLGVVIGVAWRPRVIQAGETGWREWLATASASDLVYARRRLGER